MTSEQISRKTPAPLPGRTAPGLFRTPDGRNHLTTFLLVCCLFCLSGLCNEMIDVLNKHFQNSPQVSTAQSAFVQGFWYAGFFMSIMYPTHFALAIRGLGERTKLASSWMVTAIVGGAIMPLLMGWLADHYSMRVGFLIPLVCFAGITAYGFGWRKLYRQGMEPEA